MNLDARLQRLEAGRGAADTQPMTAAELIDLLQRVDRGASVTAEEAALVAELAATMNAAKGLTHEP